MNAAAWQDAIVDQICERMFVAMGAGNVQAAFKYFDVDGDGNIEYEEFVNTLKALNIGLSDEQVEFSIVHVETPSHLRGGVSSKARFQRLYRGRCHVAMVHRVDEL